MALALPKCRGLKSPLSNSAATKSSSADLSSVSRDLCLIVDPRATHRSLHHCCCRARYTFHAWHHPASGHILKIAHVLAEPHATYGALVAGVLSGDVTGIRPRTAHRSRHTDEGRRSQPLARAAGAPGRNHCRAICLGRPSARGNPG